MAATANFRVAAHGVLHLHDANFLTTSSKLALDAEDSMSVFQENFRRGVCHVRANLDMKPQLTFLGRLQSPFAASTQARKQSLFSRTMAQLHGKSPDGSCPVEAAQIGEREAATKVWAGVYRIELDVSVTVGGSKDRKQALRRSGVPAFTCDTSDVVVACNFFCGKMLSHPFSLKRLCLEKVDGKLRSLHSFALFSCFVHFPVGLSINPLEWMILDGDGKRFIQK